MAGNLFSGVLYQSIPRGNVQYTRLYVRVYRGMDLVANIEPVDTRRMVNYNSDTFGGYRVFVKRRNDFLLSAILYSNYASREMANKTCAVLLLTHPNYIMRAGVLVRSLNPPSWIP